MGMKAEVLLEHLRQALLREAQLRLELAVFEATKASQEETLTQAGEGTSTREDEGVPAQEEYPLGLTSSD